MFRACPFIDLTDTFVGLQGISLHSAGCLRTVMRVCFMMPSASTALGSVKTASPARRIPCSSLCIESWSVALTTCTSLKLFPPLLPSFALLRQRRLDASMRYSPLYFENPSSYT